MPVTDKGLGWRKQLGDFRDYRYATPPYVLRALPPSVDLRPQMPCGVWDQGALGSCTAFASCAAFVYALAHAQTPSAVPPAFLPSFLFVYYNERAMEGSLAADAGAEIRDGIKSLGTQGVCPDADWPYVPQRFADKPPDSAYADAMKHEAVQYMAVMQTATEMKGCLAEGFPIVLGATLYTSFMSDAVAQTGNVPLPSTSESVIGGHAFCIMGYDDTKQVWICRNSWGRWGDGGSFYMPYAYLLDSSLASDLWTIRAAS